MLSVGAGLRWSDVSPAARAKPPHDSQVDAAVGRRLIPIWVTCEPSGWKAVRYRRYPARLPKPAEVRAGGHTLRAGPVTTPCAWRMDTSARDVPIADRYPSAPSGLALCGVRRNGDCR